MLTGNRHAALRRGWLPHAAFHDFYATPRHRRTVRAARIDGLRHAVHAQAAGRPVAGLADPGAGLGNRKLDRDRFNEAYLMHTSTSPQYSIIASCDVAAAMMEAPGGTALVEESIPKRWTSAAPCARWTTSRQRRLVVQGGARTRWPKKASEREDWMLKANERWHGFGDLAEGFNMLDPIKATIITPGLDVDGEFASAASRRPSSPSTWPSTASSSRRRACTRSSSCSPSASPRAAGTRW
jgi:arginine decarboxylase